MAIDLPNNPSIGDKFTSGGRTWQWNGTAWISYGHLPDPTILKVDAVNNLVGINNATPSYTLDVGGDVNAATANFTVVSSPTISGLESDVSAAQSDISTLQSEVGNLESRPVDTKTASYTLVAGDVNKRIVMNSGSARTITVNNGVFSAGDTVWIHNIGAGTTTVTAGTATVNTAGSLDLEQWEGGSLYFTSASSAIFFRGGGAGVSYGAATGGTSSSITVGGESYTLLRFTSSSTLTVTKAGIFDVVVVGGGGGGAVFGGGGAGGYVTETVYFDANQTVTVGAGGSGGTGTSAAGGRGNASRCGGIVAGFGGGAKTLPNLTPYSNSSGASGAGGTLYDSPGNQGDGITGNNGGAHVRSGTDDSGGGGGGANAAGADAGYIYTTAWFTQGGNGGAGRDASSFRGESAGTTYYAGGGGGGSDSVNGGTGGSGGGGNGAVGGGTGGSGTANTGGGGGGSATGNGGSGGSGIVLVRFKN